MRIGLFGLPGAGKGTQAVLLSKHWQLPHVSTGDMFRDLQTGTTALAQEIAAILAQGQLVPDELVTKLAFERLGREDARQGFFLDGFPRTLSQAQALQGSPFSLNALVCLDVAREEIIRRLSGRRVCERCKSVYSQHDVEGPKVICPNDGSRLVQRPDDRVETVMTRLQVFEQNYVPVIRFYDDLGLLYHVDGDGPADLVFKRLNDLVSGF